MSTAGAIVAVGIGFLVQMIGVVLALTRIAKALEDIAKK